MKKLIVTLVAAMAFSLASFAKVPGETLLGLNLGTAPVLHKFSNHYDGGYDPGSIISNFGIGTTFRYRVLSSNTRFQADANYYFSAKDLSVFDITANITYLFHFKEGRMAVYPIAGIGFANIHDSWNDASNAARFVANAGVGAQYRISRHLMAHLDLRYQYIQDFSRIPVTAGISYIF